MPKAKRYTPNQRTLITALWLTEKLGLEIEQLVPTEENAPLISKMHTRNSDIYDILEELSHFSVTESVTQSVKEPTETIQVL